MFPQALRGDGTLQQFPFSTLPHTNSDLLARHKLEIYNNLVIAGTTPVASMPFSAWYTLAPVLFCMFELFRPRRYVELGSHCGYSFFAACQGAELAGSKAECIAIDGWEGDPHAGFYGSEVYDTVRRYLSETYPSQYTLKAYFSDALNSFDDGSIDLLHIDGFHSYQAVKNDFEGWLPKMSKRGVVIFHDTNVYERDFGVYIFWHYVKALYPSFEFRHSHGLGILFVGSDEGIKSVFSLFSDNSDYGVVLQNLMLRIAELNIANSRTILASKDLENLQLGPIPDIANSPPPNAQLVPVPDIANSPPPTAQLAPTPEPVSRLQPAKYRIKFFLTYLSPRQRRHYREKLRTLNAGKK